MNIQSNTFERVLTSVKGLYVKTEGVIDRIGDNKLKRSLLWILTVFLCFSSILFLNILTPLISDDFAYLFIYGENVRVASVGDIVRSQINHYYQWGGRSVAHFIAQVLLLLPAYFADLLNTLVYLGYVFLIYFHITGRGKGSLSLFIFINIAIWFMQPVFGDTVLWLTGSANYLWCTFLILLFLIPYRFYKGNRLNITGQILAPTGLFLLGIIAGWTNENTAGAMILIVVFFFIYYRSYTWKIPGWAIAGLLGAIIGYAVMILAPGNFERAGESAFGLPVIAYRLFNCTLTFFFYSGTLILSCLVIYILYYRFPVGERKDKLKLSIIYSIAAIAAVYAMLFSPTFPRRALFGVVTFLIIGAGILYYNLDFSQKFLRQIRLSIIAIGFISFIFTFYLAAKDINIFRNIMKEREVRIELAKRQGAAFCEFERYEGSTYIHGEDPFSEELMTRHYGIKIRLKGRD
ncbi:DUF6056 family protein [uncultured Dysgonomonas sp.]|uniref:Glycosyltransferase RgtA/B/C/D-like domain-containing protein n=1 Tax=uncultured Dysgonomonas sp. TaxID=206096 RepID=A0A212J924_9BACT|nr:DUF6056 family protein [uncultured Dysgonomonas sp.]SBV95964.1 conserved membrane hypothetical protein [uncultured Dysgonomonas sp.]